MKTIEELNALRDEVEALNKKLAALTDEEIAQVTGGQRPPTPPRKKEEELNEFVNIDINVVY